MMKINSQIISEKVDKFIDVLLEEKIDAAIDEKLKYLEDDDEEINSERDLDKKDGGAEVNPLTSKEGEEKDEVAECNKIK
jgi:hypothetical protein